MILLLRVRHLISELRILRLPVSTLTAILDAHCLSLPASTSYAVLPQFIGCNLQVAVSKLFGVITAVIFEVCLAGEGGKGREGEGGEGEGGKEEGDGGKGRGGEEGRGVCGKER